MTKPSNWIVALMAAGVLAVVPAAGQEDSHEHDHDHAEATELGRVDFPISCDAVVKKDFDRGIALLHSFGYDLARRSFRFAAADSEKCGIAWWGVAMTYYHPLWAPPTQEEASAGADAAARAKAAGAATERERAYIDAIGVFYENVLATSHASRAAAYRDKMEALVKRFPDDPEARIFLALALLGTAPAGDTTYAQQRRAGEILNAELVKQPNHPGIVHYLIHSFDYPELADLALPAARVYAQIAPASPHAQHMPSHIFTRLGLWQESIASNLASEQSAYAISTKQPGVVPGDALHALDYLEYAYLQTGQIDAAKEAMARALGGSGADSVFQSGYAVTAIPARFALERRAWKEAAALESPARNLTWDVFPYALASTPFARAIGSARLGDAAAARKAVDELGAIHGKLVAKPVGGPYDWAQQVESLRLAASAWVARAEGKNDEAVELARQAAALQDRIGKHPVTPGELLPARELLADLLLELGRAPEALAEYEATLKSNPGRLNALRGAAAAAEKVGEKKKARELEGRIDAQLASPSG